jgi:hypothetical protein
MTLYVTLFKSVVYGFVFYGTPVVILREKRQFYSPVVHLGTLLCIRT